MNITPEMREKFTLESMLHAAVVNKTNLIWDDEFSVFVYPDNASSFLPWDSMEEIAITPFEYDGDRIDGVLFFGDGTVEFHLENSQEAINWAEFPNEIIRRVIDAIPNGEHIL